MFEVVMILTENSFESGNPVLPDAIQNFLSPMEKTGVTFSSFSLDGGSNFKNPQRISSHHSIIFGLRQDQLALNSWS